MSLISRTVHAAVICAILSVCTAPPPGGAGGGPPFGGGGGGRPEGGPGGGGGPGNGRGGGGPGNGRGGEGPGNGRGPGNGNGPPRRGEGHWRGDRPQLDDEALKQLRNTWSSCRGQGRCKENRNRQQRNRNAIKSAMLKDRRGFDDATVERRFKKAYDVKKAFLNLQGLTDVDPHDNGLVGGDMLFNEQQLDRIANRLKGTVDASATGEVPLVDPDQVLLNPLTGTSNRQKRAHVLALDYYGGNKWPSTTINFYINPKNFKSTEADIIRNALKTISTVSCLKFVEGWKNPVMEYVKTPSDTDDGTCGWSDVGYQGNYNAININFDSAICKSTLQGVVVHETLHSLGFVHEHSRYDRDKYLTIDWKNVDPQSLDVYNKDEPRDHNPYCVAFDPLSIMHYDPYVGAIDSKKPVMVPKSFSSFYLPRMGQGLVMSATDANLLNKMYCKADTCKDKSVNCGWTACGDCTTYGSVCPKSCNRC